MKRKLHAEVISSEYQQSKKNGRICVKFPILPADQEACAWNGMTWTLMILRLAWDGDTCDMPLEQGISKLLHPYEVIVQTMVDCIVCKQKAQKKKWKLIKFLFSLKLQKSNIYPCTGYGSVFYIFSLIQRYVDLLCVWEKKRFRILWQKTGCPTKVLLFDSI